jgi:hypothetical protein
MPLWTGRASVDEVVGWARRLRAAVASVAPGLAVGTGDGVMNLKGGQNGFDAGRLARERLVDFVGPHTYHADLDPLRQALWPELVVRALQPLGLPVLLEEFGGSATQASPDHLGAFYRETVHGVFATGGAGVLGWCFASFPLHGGPGGHGLADQPPYRHHAFELSFGVADRQGEPLLAGRALEAAARFFGTLDLGRLEHPEPEAAIVVPSYYTTAYPFSWEDRGRMRHTLAQAYALAAKAGLEVDLVEETPEGIGDLGRYRLLLVPSTQKLLAPTWKALRARAQEGAVVYASYYSGDYDFHQGLWIDDLEGTAGVRHRLRYGCFDLPEPLSTLHVVDDEERYDLAVDTRVGSAYGRAYLPLEPVAATVVGRDGRGRPALVRHRLGSGWVYFLAYPWEHYLAEHADINERDGSEALYRHLARVARVPLHDDVGDPLCQRHLVLERSGPPNGEARELLWLINRRWTPTEIRLRPDPAARWVFPVAEDAPLDGGSMRLGPKEVRVLARPRRVTDGDR